MAHPLVDQLRFARSEFRRGLVGLTEEDATHRVLPANCISWNVGHLSWQEQRYFLPGTDVGVVRPDVAEQFAYGAPASTPSLADVLTAWEEITSACDPWLDAVTTEKLQEAMPRRDGTPSKLFFGTLLLRTTYHYWYHCGENLGLRQAMGHTGLPDFVGDIDSEAPYRPESAPLINS